MYPNRSNKLSGIVAVISLAAIPCFFALLGYEFFGKSLAGAILGGLVGAYALYRYVRMFDE